MNRSNFYYTKENLTQTLIIGRAGKTICKTALQSILADDLVIQNHISGQVDTTKVNVYDIAIHHQKEFNTFKQHVVPNCVIVTNIGEGHLVYQSKHINFYQEIKTYLESLPENTLFILNKDDDLVSQLSDQLNQENVVKFGLNQRADIFASKIEQKGPEGISFKLNNSIDMIVPIYEFNHIYNILSAIAFCRLINTPIEKIVKCVRTKFMVPNGRGNLVTMNGVSVINDTYKNTKSNVATAAQTLVSFKNYSKRMVMVIGEIDSEGANSESVHMNSGHFLSALPIDIVMTVGKNTLPIYNVLKNFAFKERLVLHTQNVQEAVANLCLFLEEGDCILLKSDGKSGLSDFIEILDKYFRI